MNKSLPTPLVQGRIVFDEAAESFAGATLYVFLEDTSYADAGAVKVAEHVTKDVSYDASARNSLSFTLYGDLQDQRAHYTVRVLVDLNGDGRISHGDFINVQSYPVLTWGHPNEVTIHVERV